MILYAGVRGWRRICPNNDNRIVAISMVKGLDRVLCISCSLVVLGVWWIELR
jgi:hypothetical protein